MMIDYLTDFGKDIGKEVGKEFGKVFGEEYGKETNSKKLERVKKKLLAEKTTNFSLKIALIVSWIFFAIAFKFM